jgi:hypothetical protein
MMKHLIWGIHEAKYFRREDWTAKISLKRQRKLAFWRTRFCPCGPSLFGYLSFARFKRKLPLACHPISFATRVNRRQLELD